MLTALRMTTICALVLATTAAGCARTPKISAPAAAVPMAASTAATAQAAESPTGDDAAAVIEYREQETIITERPQPSEFSEAAEVKTIFFDFDRADIRPGDAKTLEANAAWLKTHEVLVLIAGQCDERGTAEYNVALGDRRAQAQAARNYLIAQGIAASRILTVSYGKERPVCTEHTEECWAANRRAHFLVKARG
jgi:peptidoglycan-associated lipoprotein